MCFSCLPTRAPRRGIEPRPNTSQSAATKWGRSYQRPGRVSNQSCIQQIVCLTLDSPEQKEENEAEKDQNLPKDDGKCLQSPMPWDGKWCEPWKGGTGQHGARHLLDPRLLTGTIESGDGLRLLTLELPRDHFPRRWPREKERWQLKSSWLALVAKAVQHCCRLSPASAAVVVVDLVATAVKGSLSVAVAQCVELVLLPSRKRGASSC